MGMFRDTSVHELVRSMTLKEKVSLLSGLDDWRTVPIDRLGIPSITMTEGPHGVRANFEHTARARGVYRRSLSVYDAYTRDWVVTPGEIEIRVVARHPSPKASAARRRVIYVNDSAFSCYI